MCWRATHAALRGSHLCCFSYRLGDEAFQYYNVCKNLPGFRSRSVLAARWQSANCVTVCLYENGWLLRLKREGKEMDHKCNFFAAQSFKCWRFEYSKSGLRWPTAFLLTHLHVKIFLRASCADTHATIVQAQASRQFIFPPAPHYFWPYYLAASDAVWLHANVHIHEGNIFLGQRRNLKKYCA